MNFSDLGLSPSLLAAISDAGYTQATPIQAGAIPVALQGRDLLGIAQTGTGKTASFVLPMIEMLSQGRAKARMPRSLILEPTRELAAQVADNFKKYGKNHKLSMALLIGGVSFGDQEEALMRGVDVLIATPGRLLDHFERGKLLLSGVQLMVVDEADRMLDMGFIPDIERIFKLTPFTRQTLFFSATMPPEIQRITDQFLSNAERVEVSRPASASVNISQFIVRCPNDDPKARRTALRAAISQAQVTTGIVFCNRKTDVDIVAKSLQTHGFSAAPIHGDLPQSVRTATLDKFRAGEIVLLVASDVAARGLDIPEVGHVFNFDPPRNPDDYVHRIGRTGRAGRLGEAYTIITPRDSKQLAAIMGRIGTDIPDANIADMPDLTHIRTDERAARPGRDRDRGPRREDHDARPTRAPRERVEADAESATSEGRPPRRRNPRRPQPEQILDAGVDREVSFEAPDEDITVTEDAVPRAKRAARGPRNAETSAAPRSARAPKPPAPVAKARASEARERVERVSHAFGDHLPAFLQIPIAPRGK